MNGLPITRRAFVQNVLVAGAGAVLGRSGADWAALAAAPDAGFCVTLCNHWSYIGIGWQLGIESNVLSVTDGMEMADRAPYVKTCINLDARAYEFMAEKFPVVAARLSRYLAEGKVELIGGTYGQPMGTTVGGESNIRQVVVGRETIRKALGYEMVTFLEEEEFSHPQLPQILVGAGFRYASLAQLDTWGRAGVPHIEVNSFQWKGKDGTTILCTPKNSLFGAALDAKQLAASPSFQKLQKLGKPLVFAWAEFGWESPEAPAYLTAPEGYRKIAAESLVEFVSLKEYLDKYGTQAEETVCLNMDSWDKSLTWGIGGDQLRILDRQVEGLLLAAERFDALAVGGGAKTNARRLERAWKDLLASQSHDVGLCEYSRWQGDRMAPLDRVEDLHNFTWGALGYNHLDAAQREAKDVLAASLSFLANQIDAQSENHGQLAVTVFNPQSWERSGVVQTDNIYLTGQKARGLRVKDRTGRVVPAQLVKQDADSQGNLELAKVAFRPSKVRSVGFDTYYVEFTSEPTPSETTGLQLDVSALVLENEHLRIRFDPTTGAISSLVAKPAGREMLQSPAGAFPRFMGRPNTGYPLRSIFGSKNASSPYQYDSAPSKAELRWLEKGPVRATLRARHHWPLMKFETHITLSAGCPYVEVLSRVLAEVPPAVDASPAVIKEGYWLSFAPSFQPEVVLRDFPFAIEPTVHRDFHALTFVDLVGKDAGLLVLHAGTQYFHLDNQGRVANLLMREWESFWTGEYGWPRYAEYRHALLPHGPDFSHVDRVRASAEFGQSLFSTVGQPKPGKLPKAKSYVTIAPDHAQLSSLRKLTGPGTELRVVEVSGQPAEARVELGFPVTEAAETDLLGRKTGDVSHSHGQLQFPLPPWRIQTFRLT